MQASIISVASMAATLLLQQPFDGPRLPNLYSWWKGDYKQHGQHAACEEWEEWEEEERTKGGRFGSGRAAAAAAGVGRAPGPAARTPTSALAGAEGIRAGEVITGAADFHAMASPFSMPYSRGTSRHSSSSQSTTDGLDNKSGGGRWSVKSQQQTDGGGGASKQSSMYLTSSLLTALGSLEGGLPEDFFRPEDYAAEDNCSSRISARVCRESGITTTYGSDVDDDDYHDDVSSYNQSNLSGSFTFSRQGEAGMQGKQYQQQSSFGSRSSSGGASISTAKSSQGNRWSYLSTHSVPEQGPVHFQDDVADPTVSAPVSPLF